MGLEGKTILVTRARGQSRELCSRLEQLGARVLEIPTVEILEPETWAPVDRAIAGIAAYDWVVFTSANAVDAFVNRAGALPPTKIAAVGAATSRRLEERGRAPDRVPEDFRAEGLIAAFAPELRGVRILLPRAEAARELLPEALRERGATVDVVAVYRTVRPSEGAAALRRSLEQNQIDCITFTSGSTVRNLIDMLGTAGPARLLTGPAIAVIGPVTRQAVLDASLPVDIEARAATIPDLVDAIRGYFEVR